MLPDRIRPSHFWVGTSVIILYNKKIKKLDKLISSFIIFVLYYLLQSGHLSTVYNIQLLKPTLTQPYDFKLSSTVTLSLP